MLKTRAPAPCGETKAFSLRFLTSDGDHEFNEAEWIWTPHRDLTATDIQTATFSGKNKADDYKNE